MVPRPTLLTIAGFDPGSGAGITADLQVFAAHAYFGTSAITALTVQNTVGVRAVQPVQPEWLSATLSCLTDDLPPLGIKIGMLATAENVSAVADYLERQSTKLPVVLDPVMVSSSGRELLNSAGVHALRTRLLPLVSVVTPNRAELERLTGEVVVTREDMERAGRRLVKAHGTLQVVVTGGDLRPCSDCVVADDAGAEWLNSEPVNSNSTHGTGCAFSSALLCSMVGEPLRPLLEHARAAKSYVQHAIETAVPVGHGKGPMNLTGVR